MYPEPLDKLALTLVRLAEKAPLPEGVKPSSEAPDLLTLPLMLGNKHPTSAARPAILFLTLVFLATGHSICHRPRMQFTGGQLQPLATVWGSAQAGITQFMGARQ